MDIIVGQFQGGSTPNLSGVLKDNLTGSDFKPYATCIGLYNERNELLVVGKLAQPYPIPANTDITFVVRWDS
jgi:hypothetical protein